MYDFFTNYNFKCKYICNNKLCVLLNRPFRSFFQLLTWTCWGKSVDTTEKSTLNKWNSHVWKWWERRYSSAKLRKFTDVCMVGRGGAIFFTNHFQAWQFYSFQRKWRIFSSLPMSKVYKNRAKVYYFKRCTDQWFSYMYLSKFFIQVWGVGNGTLICFLITVKPNFSFCS